MNAFCIRLVSRHLGFESHEICFFFCIVIYFHIEESHFLNSDILSLVLFPSKNLVGLRFPKTWHKNTSIPPRRPSHRRIWEDLMNGLHNFTKSRVVVPLLRQVLFHQFSHITIRARGYKTLFMLTSVENEILNAHKCKKIKKFSNFQAQINLELYFSYS